jgi:acetyltransferase-like isoleucine patch superfamily enzyme
MLIKNDKPLVAISYNTATFFLLSNYIKQETSLEIERIEPVDFFKNPSDDFQYINLVTLDLAERKKIVDVFKKNCLDRFTYVHDEFFRWKFSDINVVNKGSTVGQGCFIYPGVWAYLAQIGDDCIIHSFARMAENVRIGNNVFLSGSVTIAGGSEIGDNCFISTNTLIMDHVKITNDVHLLPGMTIKKSINKPGKYYNPNVFEIKEFKEML